MTEFAAFNASTEHGFGIGRTMSIPTINLVIEQVPASLEYGIYACMATLDQGERLPATMHLGPRPVFDQPTSCEVHILDRTGVPHPASVRVEPIAYLREIRNFPSPEELIRQIHTDNEQARGILGLS